MRNTDGESEYDTSRQMQKLTLTFRYCILPFLAAGVREQLHKAEFFDKANENHLYLSIHDAVVSAFHQEPELQQQVSD